MDFKCGFYSELAELKRTDAAASFGFLENLRVTSESSAWSFLHGCCDEFAAILSDVFGYEIECVRNAEHRLIHAYCTAYISNEKAYIDVRGITTDPELFFSEFKNELFYYSPTGVILVENEDGHELEAEKETWASKNELFEGEYEHWDDPEIEAFIKDYKDYYDSDLYMSIYKCKACGSEFEELSGEDCDWFEVFGEEALWGHIQLDHPDFFEDCQALETPDMLEVCYDHIIEKKSMEKERLALREDVSAPVSQSLDAMISAARDTLSPPGGSEGVGAGARENQNEQTRKRSDAPAR